MFRPIRSWQLATIGTLAVAFASAELAADEQVWSHFGVGQAVYQVSEDPFEPEPEPLPTPPGLEEPQPMPPDPAYEVPEPVPPTRRVPSPAPLVPPYADIDPTPPAPAVCPPACTEGACVPLAAGCATMSGSPLRQWTCDACCDGAPGSLRHGGLPLGIRWEGWIAQGVTLNPRRPDNRSNLPVTFNDRANNYQLNQLYLAAERPVRYDDWSVGGRIDLLYGTDHRFTMARGLEVQRDLSPRWNSEEYGLAMPQLYMEAFAPVGTGVNVKMGHFYTILGFESVPSPENFFYSRSYAMQYGEPFTHTGLLAATEVGPLQFQAGFTRGWDNWENNFDELGFLGGASWTSRDGRTTLAFAIHTGSEESVLLPGSNPRTTYSLVFAHNLYGPWSCVVQHDLGVDRRAMPDGSDARWHGLNVNVFREITEHWKFGYRFEWFRDDDGTRVITGMPADYYQVSLGLNYSPSDRLRVRPSLRWDWAGAGDGRPFVDRTRSDQMLLDCDVIILF